CLAPSIQVTSLPTAPLLLHPPPLLPVRPLQIQCHLQHRGRAIADEHSVHPPCDPRAEGMAVNPLLGIQQRCQILRRRPVADNVAGEAVALMEDGYLHASASCCIRQSLATASCVLSSVASRCRN